MDISKDEIEARIAELQEERAKFIAQANQTVAAYDGAIGELNRWLGKENKNVVSTEE